MISYPFNGLFLSILGNKTTEMEYPGTIYKTTEVGQMEYCVGVKANLKASHLLTFLSF